MAQPTRPARARHQRSAEEEGTAGPLPPLLPFRQILRRFETIFPPGTPSREFILRDSTARTVFSALYIGAVEGLGRWLAPRHVYRMRDDIAADDDPGHRMAFYRRVPPSAEGRWYADNTRETARDEGVRRGLVPLNAMVVREGVQTTSLHGRYALKAAFASLLDPELSGDAFELAAQAWRQSYLAPAALTRAALMQTMDAGSVVVQHPQGGSTVLPPGESPRLTKQVVEVFAHKFLARPALAWISDSREKMFQDARITRHMQIELDAARLLPDVILVDLNPPGRTGSLLIVLVEVVHTDGPVDEGRKRQMLDLLAASPRGYTAQDVAFVTVYADRSSQPARRAVRELAWGSFAWFASEPDHLIQFRDSPPGKLSEML